MTTALILTSSTDLCMAAAYAVLTCFNTMVLIASGLTKQHAMNVDNTYNDAAKPTGCG